MARETLVMLPGMMCDARLFGPQIAALEESQDIVVPSLCDPPSIEGLARRLLDEIDAPRFNLLGLTMGGIVAMAIAGLAPERVARLALLDTNHLADAPERRAIRGRQIADAKAGRLRAVIAEEMKPNYLATANSRDQGLLDLLIAMAMALGEDCFVNQSLALRDRPDQTEALRRYGGPALVLCGAEDTLCPPLRHTEMSKLLRCATLVCIPNAGHLPTLEQPESVNREVRMWLNV